MRRALIIVAVALLAAVVLYLDDSWRDSWRNAFWAHAFCDASAQFTEAWARTHPRPGDERPHRLAECTRRTTPKPKPWTENSESRARVS